MMVWGRFDRLVLGVRGRKRVEGIEPSSLAWKAIALPLSYTRGFRPGRDWGVQDSNLRRHSHQIYSLTPLTARETPLVCGGLLDCDVVSAIVDRAPRPTVGDGADTPPMHPPAAPRASSS